MNGDPNPVTNNPYYTAGNNPKSRISSLIFSTMFSLIFFCLGVFGMTEFYSTTDAYESVKKQELLNI